MMELESVASIAGSMWSQWYGGTGVSGIHCRIRVRRGLKSASYLPLNTFRSCHPFPFSMVHMLAEHSTVLSWCYVELPLLFLNRTGSWYAGLTRCCAIRQKVWEARIELLPAYVCTQKIPLFSLFLIAKQDWEKLIIRRNETNMIMSSDESMDSSSDSDDASTEASSIVSTGDLTFVEDLCIASIALSFRVNRQIVVRMNWLRHVKSLLHENLFHVKYRMSLESFD